MRLESIRLKGLGPFRSEVSVNLAELGDARLVAVCGDNGAGKSTLLELWGPGALYRSTPTRGALTSLATERAAFLEARVTNGRPWTLRHTVDAISGKSEAVVLDELGAPVLPDSKVRSFDAWAARALPAPEVLYSSVFAPQGASGFLGLKPGDRKAVLLRVLGVEQLERQAESARERAREARAGVATLEARLVDERARGGDVDLAAAELAASLQVADQADKVLAARRVELADVLAKAQEAERAIEAHRRNELELRANVDSLGAAREERRNKARDLEERVKNNRQVLEQRVAIESAVKLVAEWTSMLADEREEWSRETSAAAAAEAERRRQAETDQAAQRRLQAARGRVAAADARLGQREAIERAAAELPGLREQLESATAGVTSAEVLLEELRGIRYAGAEGRIDALRFGLGAIKHTTALAEAKGLAGGVLLTDEQLQADAAALPDRVKEQERAAREQKDREAVLRRQVLDTERQAVAGGDIEAAERDRVAALEDVRAADAELAAAIIAQRTAQSEREEHESKAKRAKARVEQLTADIEGQKPVAGRAERLAGATARLAELEPQLAQINAELLELERQIESTPAPVPPPTPAPSVAPFEREVAAAEDRARQAHAAAAVAEQKLDAARASAGRLVELEGSKDAADQELADWTRMAADLGRDGLQALEVDCAGPELTELTNDLLRHCVGPRWTVSIETTRLSADGKKQLEGCDVRVLDTVRGRDAAAETLSGGERVLVGEAIALALSMLACRRSGVQRPTLVRDESGAALDPVNARAYLAMLRRAADIVGASHVLFVAHNPELQELADARIVVADGAITVS